jgi:hypothetical protein
MVKSYLYILVLCIVVIAMIVLNEWGYGVISLFMLFPAVWLMRKAFGDPA